MRARTFFSGVASLPVAYANERVSPETSVWLSFSLARPLECRRKHIFFKMKQDGRGFENKTPKEIINMDRKTELKI